jgi:co-chaperonin GroES (HSP10)
MKDQEINKSWDAVLQDPKVLWKLIQLLREQRNEEEIFLAGTDVSVIFKDKQNGFYCNDEFVCKHDYIREQWKKLNPVQRLRQEAGELPFKPNSDRVILRAIDMGAFTKTKLQLLGNTKESQSVFNIYKEMPLQGIVVAVGPGFFTDSGNLRPTEVEVGDHVAIEMGAHLSDFVFNGTLYYHCRVSSILGKFDDQVAENYRKFELSFINPNIKS